MTLRENPRDRKCSLCGKIFIGKIKLKNHKQMEHTS